uniref:Parvalbumin n=1 Tax=Dicentrarchus labrax TaxID=13489 RepID=A0A8C4F6J5_DICLA
MSLTSILSAEAIENAVKDCQAPDSFCYKKFFQLCGLSSKTPQEVKDVFQILDDDNSGYIEESELKYFLQRFVPGARTLTEAETKSFISAADDDSDGKIGVEGRYLISQTVFVQTHDGGRNYLIGWTQSQWVESNEHTVSTEKSQLTLYNLGHF